MRIFFIFAVIFSQGMAAQAQIKAYFNHNQRNDYFDPYRKIQRKGDNLEQKIIDQIKSAKKSVFVAVQELRLPGIAKALAYQKSLGRDIRVILEDSYNNTIKNYKPKKTRGSDDPDRHTAERRMNLLSFIDLDGNGKASWEEMGQRDAVHILSKAKVPVIDDTFDNSRGSDLMHHKFVIIDREKVILSSANFTLSGIHGDYTNEHSLGNDNAMMVIESRELANFFTEEFLIMWGGARGRSAARFGVNKPYRGIQTTSLSDNTEVKVIFSPTSLKRMWRDSTNGLIAKEIAKAKKSINSALFVFTEQRLTNAMAKVHQKKVKVEVLAEKRMAFTPASEVMDLFGLALHDGKCEIEPDNKPWETPLKTVGIANAKSDRKGDILHHKFAVIDGKKVIFGSHNWSASANESNDEFLVIIDNRQLAQAFTREFTRIKESSSFEVPKRVLSRVETRSDACHDTAY